MPPAERTLDELLAEDAFVRRLARCLLSDEATADDVAQEAFLAALRRPPTRAPWRPWLSAVVRNLASKALRSAGRRASREAKAACPEMVPAATEYLEREEERRRVVAAVFALREPLRTTVLLRWFDEAPPREIARRLGIPVETVRTRLKTALAELRPVLADRAGRETSVRPRPMLGGALPAAASGMEGSFGQVASGFWRWILMTTKTKTAALATAAIIAVGFMAIELWSTPGGDDPVPPMPGGTALADRAGDGGEGRLPPGDPGQPAENRIVPVPFTEPARGAPVENRSALRIVALQSRGGPPVARLAVGVLARSGEDIALRAMRVRTDGNGEAVIPDILPGSWMVYADTGQHLTVEVKAGRETTCTLLVATGSELRGRVVDMAGRPVSGASVYICMTPMVTPPATVTADGEGRFVLPASKLPFLVAATAPGYALSDRVQVDPRDGADEVELLLRRAGSSVRGRVLDPDGHPRPATLRLSGATRRVDHPADAQGHALMPPPMLVIRTDEQGVFAIEEGVPAGPITITARAPGFPALDMATRAPPGGEVVVEIRLRPGATVSGVIRTEIGEPVADVEVGVPFADSLRHIDVRSREDGSYSLTGLPPGDATLEIRDSLSGLRRIEVKSLTPGEMRRLDVSIDRGAEVRVRVVDESGASVAGAMVSVSAEDQGDGQDPTRVGTRDIGTDTEGRVAFPARALGLHRVRVTAPRSEEPVTASAIAGGPEVIVPVSIDRTPRATLTGRVLDHAGEAVPQARVVWGSFPNARSGISDGAGRFKIGDIQPGSGHLAVRAAAFGSARFGPYHLAPGAVLDAGVLRLQEPGTVVFIVRTGSGAPPPSGFEVAVMDGEGRSAAQAQLNGGSARALLQPGEYVARIDGGVFDGAEEDRPFTVVAGLETLVDLVAVSARPHALAVVSARLFTPADPARLTVADAAGRTVFVRDLSEPSGQPGLSPRMFHFVPGTYRAIVEHGGNRGEAAFEVQDGAPPPEATVILLPD